MKVSVWDTYVKRLDGKIMHFDIIVPQEVKDEATIFNYGREYLLGKEVISQELTTKECKFCHIEEASETIQNDIDRKGYHIAELNNCF